MLAGEKQVDSHQIAIDAPARLHLGFIDLHGGRGRRFGSVGVAVDGIGARLRARAAATGEGTTVAGPDGASIADVVSRFQRALGFGTSVHINVLDTIPKHVGLGSGTQAALATGVAVSELLQLGLAPRQIATLLDRGARSGIGLGVFEHGGFVVDGGRAERSETPPPVVSRVPFPEAWRVVLIFDRRGRGIHGQQEIDAFKALPPFPEAHACQLARLVLMQLLPGLVEQHIDEFGAALAELQDRVGDHFAPAQGGRFASERVARCLASLRAAGIAASGQSSWGPTGFAIVAGAREADELIERAARELPDDCRRELQFKVVAGRNRGAIREFEPGEFEPDRT